MSLSGKLCIDTLETIVGRLGLTEVHGPDGGPMVRLVSQMEPEAEVGAARVFEGDGLERLVYVGLAVPAMGLDSHMLFAFTPPTSAVPHFTLDSVSAGPTYAFHLDLIPRMDLGMNLAYMDAALAPLTEIQAGVQAWEGLTPAHLSPRQHAIMSPWMLAHRADEHAFRKLGEPVGQYLSHWLSLLEDGLPDEALVHVSKDDLDHRDRIHRSILFNPDVDPVWGRVAKLVGEETCERVRGLLLRGE